VQAWIFLDRTEEWEQRVMLDEPQKAMIVLVIHQEPPASLGRQAKKACEKRNDAPVVTSEAA